MFCGKCGTENPEGNAFCAKCGVDLSKVTTPSHDSRTIDMPTPESRQDMRTLIDRTIDKYRITKKLGEGGMGAVFLAEHVSLKQPRAIKILPGALASNKDYIARFFREAQSVAAIDNPNIVRVFDAGEAEGLYFFAMEFVDGDNVADTLKAKGPFEWHEALDIIKQVLEAFRAAHGKGIIHRDIKPENIMRTKDGVAKVADFGLAKNVSETSHLTRTGQIMGTPLYMSPEQCLGEELDQRADIYSLGATFYAMLAGRPMFKADTPLAILQMHCSKEPDAITEVVATIPAALGTIIHKMVAKDPSVRYQNADEVLTAISDFELRMDSAVDATVHAKSDHIRKALKTGQLKRTGSMPSVGTSGIKASSPASKSAIKPPPATEESEEESPPKKSKTALLIIGAVVIVAVLAVVAVFALSGPKKETARETATVCTMPAGTTETAVETPKDTAPAISDADREKAEKERIEQEADKAAAEAERALVEGNPEHASRMAAEGESRYGRTGKKTRFGLIKKRAEEALASKLKTADDKFARHARDGEEFMKKGDLPNARKSYEEALKIKQDAACAKRIGEIEDRIKKHDEDMEKARELSIKPHEYELALEQAKLAKASYDSEAAEKLIASLEKAIAERPPLLAVADFIVKGDVGLQDPGAAISDLVAQNITVKYTVLTRVEFEKALSDLGMKMGEVSIDIWNQHKKKLYEERGIRYVIVGAAVRFGQITLNSRLIDAKTGKVVQTAEMKADDVKEMREKITIAAKILCMTDDEKKALVEMVAKAQKKETEPPPKTDDGKTQAALKTVENSIGMKFVLIPAGEFMMGAAASDKFKNPGEDEHKVKITKPFYMQTTEVTQKQWTAVMGANPSLNRGDDMPVEQVRFDEAVEYCKKLSEKDGAKYRLPTEAEWEYACRAGATTRYYFGDDDSELGDYGWYLQNSGKKTHPVGKKKPNAWGLYDMHGNVWEWCSDWYGKDFYKNSPSEDPKGAALGANRVLRGGAWFYDTKFCRSSHRGGSKPNTRDPNVGLRVVRIEE